MPTTVNLPGNHCHGYTRAQVDTLAGKLISIRIAQEDQALSTGGRVVLSGTVDGESVQFAQAISIGGKSLAEIDHDIAAAIAYLDETDWLDPSTVLPRFSVLL